MRSARRSPNTGGIPAAPLFPVPNIALDGFAPLLGALGLGVVCGAAAWVLTKAVYGAEDAFSLLPIHWSWWPLLGGLVVGLGGLIQPRALGVGYDTIAGTLAGKLAIATLVSVLVVKLVIWSVALGSGTSGGILAPILMMGAALGGIASPILPGGSESSWAVLGMTAVMAGVMRSPLTAVIFAVELTHDVDLLLPLLLVAVAAHLISVLTLPRSILTEKVARRGFHVVREYAVEPLEALFVRDVMQTEPRSVPSGRSAAAVYAGLEFRSRTRPAPTPPGRVALGLDARRAELGRLLDVLARGDLDRSVDELMHEDVVTAFPDETLRIAADRMVAHRVRSLPVVERDRTDHLVGLVAESDLLRARERRLLEERHRERVLRLRR